MGPAYFARPQVAIVSGRGVAVEPRGISTTPMASAADDWLEWAGLEPIPDSYRSCQLGTGSIRSSCVHWWSVAQVLDGALVHASHHHPA